MRAAHLAIGICSLAVSVSAVAQAPVVPPDKIIKPTPLILEADQGEKRVWRPFAGEDQSPHVFFLKVDSQSGGSQHLVMGFEPLEPGGVIDLHKHLAQDEIVFLENGRAHVTLGNREQDVRGATTIFIPRGTWITFKNTGTQTIGMVFVFSNPGFENYMRCSSVPYGQPLTPITHKQDRACAKLGQVMYK